MASVRMSGLPSVIRRPDGSKNGRIRSLVDAGPYGIGRRPVLLAGSIG